MQKRSTAYLEGKSYFFYNLRVSTAVISRKYWNSLLKSFGENYMVKQNKGSSDIWSDVNRRLFETIATISRVQLFLSQ